MSQTERQIAIQEILSSLDVKKGLRNLFTELNYDLVNKPVPKRNINPTALELLEDIPQILFTGGDGDFKVIFSHLKHDRLLLTHERTIVEQLIKIFPYALFIFSNNNQDYWHFVNVKITAGDDEDSHRDRKRRRLFRRITIGPEERLRTAAERIELLDIEYVEQDLFGLSPLAIQSHHDNAFDVEKVTKAFYEDYSTVFNEFQKDLAEQTDDKSWAHDYALQFLNRCMFIYFVQRKRWLNEDPDFLHGFWRAYKKSDSQKDLFFIEWLKVLFFEAFNNRFPGRYPYMPKEINKALQEAPYLNGGLFTENELDSKYIFTISDRRIELILNFLDHYNFTVSEDTPLDQEVAVDAEMLGKVYESLVNVTKDVDERSDAGIFYTPRTEIDLMCRLSFVDYVANNLGDKYKNLIYEAVFAFSHDEKEEADRNLEKKNLWPEFYNLLENITVVDPACGSGSFLIGMLHVLDDLIVRAHGILGRHERPYDRRKRIIDRSLYGVDVKRWAVNVAELRLWLQLVIETELDKGELKLQPLLPNLSFKLRCGDSLVQEIGGMNLSQLKSSRDIPPALKGRLTRLKGEKRNFFHDIKACKFKNVEQLKQEEYLVFKDILSAREESLAKDILKMNRLAKTETKSMFDDGSELKKSVERKSFEQEAGFVKLELDKATKALRILKKEKQVPFVWQIAFVEIFEGDKRGFDIVIGNPPYVRQESIADPMIPQEDVTRENKKEYKARLISSVYSLYPKFFGADIAKPIVKIDAKSDLYIYFYFHGLDLLNDKGSFCFITSNSWLDVGYGKNLQEFLLKQSHVKLIIDNQVKRSFASADVNTIIALFGSPTIEKAQDKTARFVMFQLPFDQILSPVIFEEIESANERKILPEFRVFPIKQDKLLEDGMKQPEDESISKKIKIPLYTGNKWGGKYLRAPEIYWTILEKGKGKLVRLGDIAEVRFGIKTGANEFFYLNDAKIKEWGIEEEFLKPVIKSPRECKRILIDPKDLKYKIFMCHKDKKELKGTAALEYIKWGESQETKGRQKQAAGIPWCELASVQGRKNWYSVNIKKPGEFFCNRFFNDRFFFAYAKGIIEDQTFYAGFFKEKSISIEYIMAFMNCSFTYLTASLLGRVGLGEGVLQYAVFEMEDLIIFDPWAFNKKIIKPLTNEFEKLKFREIESIYEEMKQPDRRKLDNIIFGELGLTQKEIEAVYNAVINLVDNRLNKAESF